MKNKISKLINVKSIITLLLTSVFSYLALTGKVASNEFMNVFNIVIAFYFCTQIDKKNGETGTGHEDDKGGEV